MAQGKLKVKTKLPVGAKKQKQRPKKPLGPKKGDTATPTDHGRETPWPLPHRALEHSTPGWCEGRTSLYKTSKLDLFAIACSLWLMWREQFGCMWDGNVFIDDLVHARQIAPKKNKIVQAVKLQKGLEKELRMNIEQEMSSRASREGKPFTVAGLTQDSSSKDSKK